MTSGWQELERRHLTFTKFAIIHESGDRYKLCRGEINASPATPVSAYFYDQSGGIQFLERLPPRR